MDKSLSDAEITRKLKGTAKIVLYKDLKKFKTLDSLLGPKRRAVILYPSVSDTNGHWTTVFETVNDQGEPIIEFFDPYGIFIDDEWDKIAKHLQKDPYLARLLYESGYPVSYNEFHIQKYGDNIATCGRHVILRLMLQDIPLSMYEEIFDGTEDPDELVTRLIKV